MVRKRFLGGVGVFGMTWCMVSAFAGVMGADDSLKLSLPNLKPGFGVNATALWLKPGASNLNYAILNKALPLQSPSWAEQELKPGFAPGFELGVRYVFPHAGGKDAHLGWMHFNSHSTASVVAENDQYFIGPDYQIGPDAIPIRSATGAIKFQVDVVNLEASQFLEMGDHLEMQFLGGLSAGFLREEQTSTYMGTVSTGLYAGPFSTQQQVISHFSGVGPRVGLHADYRTRCGFGLMTEGSAALLIGGLDSQSNYLSSSQQLLVKYNQASNAQTITDQRVYQVVPGFNGKLGAHYTHAFNSGVEIKVEAGYQAAVYINAISQYIPSSLVSGAPLQTGGIFVATMSHTLSNYSMQGPYLNVALQL